MFVYSYVELFPTQFSCPKRVVLYAIREAITFHEKCNWRLEVFEKKSHGSLMYVRNAQSTGKSLWIPECRSQNGNCDWNLSFTIDAIGWRNNRAFLFGPNNCYTIRSVERAVFYYDENVIKRYYTSRYFVLFPAVCVGTLWRKRDRYDE